MTKEEIIELIEGWLNEYDKPEHTSEMAIQLKDEAHGIMLEALKLLETNGKQ